MDDASGPGRRASVSDEARQLRTTPDLVDRSGSVDSFRNTVLSLFRYRELLKNLVSKDLKLKYRGSVLGFVWSLLNPLLMIGVYTVVFKYYFRTPIEGFVLYLMLGILPWTFFVNSLMMSTGSILDNSGLVKSVFFPRAILPVATVLFNFAQFALTLLVILPIVLTIYGRPVTWTALAFPVLLALQLLFTIGLALLLAAGTVFFRDIKHLLEIVLGMLFWATPIVYHPDQVPQVIRPLLRLTPLSPFIEGYHDIFFYGRWPAPWIWGLVVAYAGVAVVAGVWVMVTREDQFSEGL